MDLNIGKISNHPPPPTPNINGCIQMTKATEQSLLIVSSGWSLVMCLVTETKK